MAEKVRNLEECQEILEDLKNSVLSRQELTLEEIVQIGSTLLAGSVAEIGKTLAIPPEAMIFLLEHCAELLERASGQGGE